MYQVNTASRECLQPQLPPQSALIQSYMEILEVLLHLPRVTFNYSCISDLKFLLKTVLGFFVCIIIFLSTKEGRTEEERGRKGDLKINS